MEEREELRHDAFHLVGDEHLVAVELNLVLLQVDVRLDAREVEDTREVEGVVDVQVNPEQRLVLHGVEGAIERLVVLVLQRRRGLCPQGLHVVDDVILIGVLHLSILPLLLLAEAHGHGHELAVFLQQALDALALEELLAVVGDVENDIGTAVLALSIFDGELRTAVASPAHGLSAFLIGAGDDFHLLADHECRVEAQSEMADDGVGRLLVFIEEVGNAREGNLVDVLVDFLGCHADASVADGKRLCLLVEGHANSQVAQLTLVVAAIGQRLHLLCGIDGVRDHLAQEYFMIAVEKLFDDGEYVLCRNPDVTFLHSCM